MIRLFLLSTRIKNASQRQERAIAQSYDPESLVYRHSSRNAMPTPTKRNGQTKKLLM
jgi:hypothetical protein